MATLNLEVNASADDAQQNDDVSTTDYTDTKVTMRRNTAGTAQRKHGGVIFNNVTLAQGTTVDSAYLSLYLEDASKVSLYCTVYGNDVDDADDFSTEDNIDNRTMTTASTSVAESSMGSAPGYSSTIDVTSAVNEILARVSWASGNSLGLMLIADEGADASCRFNTYDEGDGNYTKLDITYSSVTDAPDAPTNLTATPTSSDAITVAWTDNSSGADQEDNFELERQTGGGGFSKIGEPVQDVEVYYDSGLDPETAYEYRIRGVNVIGNGDYSTTATGTTPIQVDTDGLDYLWDATVANMTSIYGSNPYAQEVTQAIGAPITIEVTEVGYSQGQIGVWCGAATKSNVIDYITINNADDAIDFGDLDNIVRYPNGASNGPIQRGLSAGGEASGDLKQIDYITINSPDNAQDFGDMTIGREQLGACNNGSNNTALFGGRRSHDLEVDTISMASLGDASHHGDLTVSRGYIHSTISNDTNERGLFAGGHDGSGKNTIDYFTINSVDDAYDFGDLWTADWAVGGTSNGVNDRAVMGGVGGTRIDYVAITSLGSGEDFGDLSHSAGTFATSNKTDERGVFCGNSDSGMDFITINSLGSSTTFGESSDGRSNSSVIGSNSL